VALTGDLGETPFPDLVQFYCQRREPVALRVLTADGSEGVFWIDSGQLVDAELGNARGLDAVRAALRLRSGSFRVEQHVDCPPRAIFEPWTKVLLEAAWQEDEASRESPQEVTPLTMPKVPTPIRSQPITARPVMQPPPPPRRRGVGILLGVAVLLGASIPGVLWLRTRGGGSELPPKAPPATPPQVASTTTVPGTPAAKPQPGPDLVFGMSAALSGPAKELGRAMKTGIEVAFAVANDSGGVHGRNLRLVALDDGYEPTRTIEAMKELAEKHHVFGFIGNVGTPTSAVAAPYAVEHKMLFFGAFTGAKLLRKEPPDRYVFNYRASYVEETSAMVKWLVEVKRVSAPEIAVFAQEDSYGDAGFEGVAKAMRRYRRDPAKILRVGYKRNTSDVAEAVAEISRAKKLRAVVMVATYRAAAKFIEKLRDKNTDLIFTNVSFVGSTALAEELVQLGPKYAQGAIVTQVVPLPQSNASAVLHYQDQLKKYAPGEKPDFVSLEGYLSGQLLVEGLRRAGVSADTEKVVDALENIRGLDLGTGAPISFGMSEHQGSHKVWGTVLDEKGSFSTIEMD
jgi:ABC-type branched-subunit amino acid transport system substrate-binding protein